MVSTTNKKIGEGNGRAQPLMIVFHGLKGGWERSMQWDGESIVEIGEQQRRQAGHAQMGRLRKFVGHQNMADRCPAYCGADCFDDCPFLFG
jgi:hypothetical protein